MNAANIPSKFEFVHQYNKLLIRLAKLIDPRYFGKVLTAMNEHDYVHVPGWIWAGVNNLVQKDTSTLKTALGSAIRDRGNNTWQYTSVTEEAEEVCNRLTKLAFLMDEWFEIEESFGGAEAVRSYMADSDVVFMLPEHASS
jgi:hypothetical protein